MTQNADHLIISPPSVRQVFVCVPTVNGGAWLRSSCEVWGLYDGHRLLGEKNTNKEYSRKRYSSKLQSPHRKTPWHSDDSNQVTSCYVMPVPSTLHACIFTNRQGLMKRVTCWCQKGKLISKWIHSIELVHICINRNKPYLFMKHSQWYIEET